MTEKRFRGGGGEMFGGTQAFRSPTLGPSTDQPGGEVTKCIVTLQSYMQKTCNVAEKAILAKKKLRKKCVNRDKM